MDATFRSYDDRDLDAVIRVWKEAGWWSDEADFAAGLAGLLQVGDAEVAELDGEPEAMVHRTLGRYHYTGVALPLCAITAVTTSLVGRKLDLASTLTARALAKGGRAGVAMAALGMFEQGFYDRFGFGTAAYDHELSFDPATLLVGHVPYRPPVRLGVGDAADIHAALLARPKSHGAIDLEPSGLIAAEMALTDNMIALGYRDADGTLTHCFIGSKTDPHGPLRVTFMAYRDLDDFLELLRLVRELGDQIRSVKIIEPPHVQLQVLVDAPMRQSDRSNATPHASGNRALAWMQLRILDLDACVAARTWPGVEVVFNLRLRDPMAQRDGDGWGGLGGDYTVTVGSPSRVTTGHAAGLPVLDAGVGAFTRLWVGVGRASSLAATDDLTAPPELLERLDEALLLPAPLPGWDF